MKFQQLLETQNCSIMKGQYSCTAILKPWQEDPRADKNKGD